MCFTVIPIKNSKKLKAQKGNMASQMSQIMSTRQTETELGFKCRVHAELKGILSSSESYEQSSQEDKREVGTGSYSVAG